MTTLDNLMKQNEENNNALRKALSGEQIKKLFGGQMTLVDQVNETFKKTVTEMGTTVINIDDILAFVQRVHAAGFKNITFLLFCFAKLGASVTNKSLVKSTTDNTEFMWGNVCYTLKKAFPGSLSRMLAASALFVSTDAFAEVDFKNGKGPSNSAGALMIGTGSGETVEAIKSYVVSGKYVGLQNLRTAALISTNLVGGTTSAVKEALSSSVYNEATKGIITVRTLSLIKTTFNNETKNANVLKLYDLIKSL